MPSDRNLHERLHSHQIALMAKLHPQRASYVRALEASIHPGYRFPWRVADAPALIPREIFDRDVAAMRRLVEPYFTPEFRARYRDLCPGKWKRPDDGGWFPRFIATDFQRTWDPDEGFRWCVPEIQSFPGNLLLKPAMVKALLPWLHGWREEDLFLNRRFTSEEEYRAFLKEIVVGGGAPEDTIILEVRPQEQKTLVDMLLFVRHLGVRLVDLRDVEIDPATHEVLYRRAMVFERGVPVVKDFDAPQAARRILSRCLPEEIEEAQADTERPVGAERIEALFQGSITHGTAEWVVHPQDFFVLCKATLVGNAEHRPPLRRMTRALLEEFQRSGTPLDRGVLKTASSAGGKGLMGLRGGLTYEAVETLLADVEARDRADPSGAAGRLLLWQERYGADGFDRASVPGFVPAGDEERDPIFHEIRLMWAAVPRPGGAPHEVDLTLLTGMSRWSRVGQPANAGWQKTPFTGTNGVLVE